MNVRKEIDEPKKAKSKTDRVEPNLDKPKIDSELPSRAKVLKDRDAPRFTKSITEIEEPSRHNP